VHLDLRISLPIFEKIKMTPMLFLEAWGKRVHEKNLKQKNPVTMSFYYSGDITSKRNFLI
jgi:hypothetical protein